MDIAIDTAFSWQEYSEKMERTMNGLKQTVRCFFIDYSLATC